MTATSIQWTDEVWNPVRGCSRVSEGCRNCYAERQAIRQAGPGRGYEGLVESTPSGPRWTGKLVLVNDLLVEPLRWRRPRRVFVNSMSDLFHEDIPENWLDAIFVAMSLSPAQTFQVLTKRPARAREYLETPVSPDRWLSAFNLLRAIAGPLDASRLIPTFGPIAWKGRQPLSNLWLGVSVEDQASAETRVPLLIATPAAVRFLSVEPLLEEVRIPLLPGRVGLAGMMQAQGMPSLDWVIVGGESGPGARPCDVAWIRTVVRDCRESSVPVFVKQLGAKVVTDHRTRPSTDDWVSLSILRDRKGGDHAEWPEDLRVREFPRSLR